MFEKLTQLLDGFLAMGIPGYDCIIYKDGKELFRRMGGFSDREREIPVSGREKYNIYSCSKPITCAAALLLYEKGLYGLDDKLSDYMPEFAEMYIEKDGTLVKAETPITIRHLFTMTAGLSYNIASDEIKAAQKDTDGKCPTRETMKYIAKMPLLFEPGTMWHYSLCHDVLAALVEIISGQKFEDFVKENIFIPLEMNDSTFCPTEEELKEIAPQYIHDADTGETNLMNECPYRFGSEYASGGAGCVSTTEDYIKFCEGMSHGKILKDETLALMLTDQLTDESREGYWLVPDYGYGLGVRCPVEGGKNTDFGWGGAAGAYLSMDEEKDITIFYVQHVLRPQNGSLKKKVREVAYEELFGIKD